MALRLFLVGLVASLALDLPDGGTAKSRWQAGRSWLDARVTGPVAPTRTIVVNEPKAASDPAPILAAEKAEPESPVETATAEVAPVLPIVANEPVKPVVGVETALPILPGRAEADAIAAIEPKSPLDVPIVDPLPMPAPTPPIAENTSAPLAAPEAAPTALPEVATVEPVAPPAEPIEVAPPPSGPILAADETPRPAETDPDAAFRTVVGSMASAFATDVSAPAPTSEVRPLVAEAEVALPPASPALEVAAEEAPSPEESPDLAILLNREAEGLVPIEYPQPQEVVQADPEPGPEPAPTDADASATRDDRLAHAVKLTGQAVHAWANLLGRGPSDVSIQR